MLPVLSVLRLMSRCQESCLFCVWAYCPWWAPQSHSRCRGAMTRKCAKIGFGAQYLAVTVGTVSRGGLCWSLSFSRQMAWGANETSSSCPGPFGRYVLNTKSGASAKPDSEQIWAENKMLAGGWKEKRNKYSTLMAWPYNVQQFTISIIHDLSNLNRGHRCCLCVLQLLIHLLDALPKLRTLNNTKGLFRDSNAKCIQCFMGHVNCGLLHHIHFSV